MGLVIPPRIRFLKKREKFSQQVKLDLSTQQLISKLTGSAPKDSVAGKLPDSGNESNAQSESDDSQDEERNESDSAESEDNTEESTGKALFDSDGAVLKSKIKSNVTSKRGKIDPENGSSENESGNNNSEYSEYNESGDSEEDEQNDHSDKISNKLNFDIGEEDLDDILTIKKQNTEELEGDKSKTENYIKEVSSLY